MYSDVAVKLRRGHKIVFSRDSVCLRELIVLIEVQKHRTLIMWAFDCAQTPLEKFEDKYPYEHRPRKALEMCEAWARGQIKMPAAKRAILDVHAAAKEIGDDVYGALCHAIGHAGAAVHVETHALGLVFYELTSIVLENKDHNYESAVSEKINYYTERLMYWQNHIEALNVSWAQFLSDDTRPNKEKLLNEKRRLLKD